MQNGATQTEIHNEHHKLFSGSVVKGINTIDSFNFSLLPNNPAFGALRDFVTLVSVYNSRRQRYEFRGRVLYTSPQMSDKGLITQEAICESYLGFLCDSEQLPCDAIDWEVRDLMAHLIDNHNAQLEEYKHFQLGRIEMTDPSGKLKGLELQPGKTWEVIKKNLLDVLGGEIDYRVSGGVTYIDYVEKFGEDKETEIAVSKNMKSIVKEKNPSAFITRLIPLGAKIYDSSEERYGIAEVNDGKNYIDDEEAIAEYGLHVGRVEFDDLTEPADIKEHGEAWLKDNNKVSIKYSITALDLSLIGLDPDDFDVYNTYPLKNSHIGVDDRGRINKKTIDVCDETKNSIEIGESFKTLSEIQRESAASVGRLNADVAHIIRNYATNQKLASEISRTISLIEQTEESIKLSVTQGTVSQEEYEAYKQETAAELGSKVGTDEYNTYKQETATELGSKVGNDEYSTFKQETAAELELKLGKDENDKVVSMLNASADLITLTGKRLVINSDYFQLLPDGTISTTNGFIGNLRLYNNSMTAWDPMYLGSGTTAYIGLHTLQGSEARSITINIQAYANNGHVYVRLKASDYLLYETNYEIRFRVYSTNGITGRTWTETCRPTIPANGDVSEWYKDTDPKGFVALSWDGTFDANFTGLVGTFRDEDKVELDLLKNASSNSPYHYKWGGTFTSTTSVQHNSADIEIHANLIPTLEGSSLGRAANAWSSVFSANYAQPSDRNVKNTINDLDARYSALFDRLRPVTYKYNDGTSGRLHVGFIAQEVRDALEDAGISSQDFAAYCAEEQEDGTSRHVLRYMEFIPLCVGEIQKLKARVKELEEERLETV